MAKVNWNKAAASATSAAKAEGNEANVTQVKNVLNDLADYLVDTHTPGEIIDGILALASRSR